MHCTLARSRLFRNLLKQAWVIFFVRKITVKLSHIIEYDFNGAAYALIKGLSPRNLYVLISSPLYCLIDPERGLLYP